MERPGEVYTVDKKAQAVDMNSNNIKGNDFVYSGHL